MANIVNPESLGFDEIRADIETWLSIQGEMDVSDFNQSSIGKILTSALAALYNQTNLKLNSVQQESILQSAVKPESIKYLAQSQMFYQPKRKIAPQHPINTCFRFKIASEGSFSRYVELGVLFVNDNCYPISIINAKDAELEEMEDGNKFLNCRLGIGAWREITMVVEESYGHLEPFHIFTFPEKKDTIDDSKTIQVSLVGAQIDKEPIVVDNLSEILTLSDDEKKYVVLVTSNPHGGIDVNFGDGLVFGNLLYNENTKSEQATNKVTVRYFVTPGFIPNFNFDFSNIKWDKNYVDSTWFEEKWTENLVSDFFPDLWQNANYEDNKNKEDEENQKKLEKKKDSEKKIKSLLKSPIDPNRFNFKMANGIDEEDISSIKTLAPSVSIANNRILTNEDFIGRVRRIPQIKSCASRTRQIEPGNVGDAKIAGESDHILPLVPTATFELTGLTYRVPSEVIEVNTWETPLCAGDKTTGYQDFMYGTIIRYNEESSTPRFWLLVARVFQPKDKGNPVSYMYNDESDPSLQAIEEILWDEKTNDTVDVWYKYPPGESSFYIMDEQKKEKIYVPIWKEIKESEIELYSKTSYQPLTQMEWDLNFHTQYSFNSLLGFMRVRVLPPIEEIVDFNLTLVLNQNIDINTRSQVEIDVLIKKIIHEYSWELGIFLDVGKMVSDILKIPEVLQCYLHNPISNKQYATTCYINPMIKIKYQDTSKVENHFYK
jgi:hypothetical protein